MAEKKTVKKVKSKAAKSKAAKSKAAKSKAAKSKKSKKDDQFDDMGIVIVEDDLSIDKEKVNEERKAYLEEARSQEAYD